MAFFSFCVRQGTNPSKHICVAKAAISSRIVLVDRPHFCENSPEPASTVEHYSIPSGEDLA